MQFVTTPEQNYILSVLKVTKVMRRAQAVALLNKLGGGDAGDAADRCLGQLLHIRKIAWLTDDLLTLPLLQKMPVDEDMLAAMDVMLDLTAIKIHVLSASMVPYKLCFMSEQKNGYGRYAVAVVIPGSEAMVSAALLDFERDGRTVIFLLSELSQEKRIKTLLPHFFAIPDCGKYRYFSGGV